MKKKILNLLFLSSTLLLSACQGANNSESASQPESNVPSEQPSVQPSETVEPTDVPSESAPVTPSESEPETPSEPSESEPVTPSEPSESEPETPSEPSESEPGQPSDTPEMVRVTLNRNIYLEGEDLDVAKVEVWSNAFGCYTEKPNFYAEMPAEVTNGNAVATVTVGRYAANVDIKYYTTIEQAIADNPIDIPENAAEYFDESLYIDVEKQKVTFTTSTVDGVLYTVGAAASVNKKNEDTQNPTFNANILDGFYMPESGTPEKDLTPSVYDETKYTIPHYVKEEAVLDEEGNPVIGEDGTEQVKVTDYYHTTYYPTYTTTDTNAIYSQHYMYEIIVDGDGHIAYMAAVDWNNPIDISKDDAPYWSKYKDYTTNPCFALAEDYDAETNPLAYQKVLPEGGYWMVGIVNESNKPGKIDAIFKQVTGLNTNFFNGKASISLTWGDIEVENRLLQSIVKYEKINRTSYGFNAYTTADVYERYAHYYAESLKSGDADKLALRDDIYAALIYLKLPEVKAEPVLYNYYQDACSAKLEEWEAMFA